MGFVIEYCIHNNVLVCNQLFNGGLIMAKAKRLSLALIVTSVLLGLLMVVTAGFATPVAAAEETAPFTVKTFDMDRTECVDLTTSLYSDYVFYGEYYGKAVYRKPGVTNSGIVEIRL